MPHQRKASRLFPRGSEATVLLSSPLHCITPSPSASASFLQNALHLHVQPHQTVPSAWKRSLILPAKSETCKHQTPKEKCSSPNLPMMKPRLTRNSQSINTLSKMRIVCLVPDSGTAISGPDSCLSGRAAVAVVGKAKSVGDSCLV
jgi:hypothetical protein